MKDCTWCLEIMTYIIGQELMMKNGTGESCDV